MDNVWYHQGWGSRTLKLSPITDCLSRCNAVEVTLKAGQQRKFNLFFPRSLLNGNVYMYYVFSIPFNSTSAWLYSNLINVNAQNCFFKCWKPPRCISILPTPLSLAMQIDEDNFIFISVSFSYGFWTATSQPVTAAGHSDSGQLDISVALMAAFLWY